MSQKAATAATILQVVNAVVLHAVAGAFANADADSDTGTAYNCNSFRLKYIESNLQV